MAESEWVMLESGRKYNSPFLLDSFLFYLFTHSFISILTFSLYGLEQIDGMDTDH